MTLELPERWRPERLTGLHPDLARKVVRILRGMEAFGFPMFIVKGLRTPDEQHALYLQGRPHLPGGRPGKVVTNADGYRKKSNHQAGDDGYGHAVDLAFQDDPLTTKVETWDDTQPWAVMGAMAKALGLSWGGDWVQLKDRPHISDRPG